jgi:Holin of 3TMs, for gene-transfer release
MNWLKTLFSGGDVVTAVGDVADKLFTSDEERAEAELALYKAEREYDSKRAQLVADQNLGQMEVNKQEAKGNAWQAGWRPAIGWIGAVCLAYQFVLYPALLWLPVDEPPAPMDYTMVYTIITGMLGIAGMRSYDKKKGTDTK